MKERRMYLFLTGVAVLIFACFIPSSGVFPFAIMASLFALMAWYEAVLSKREKTEEDKRHLMAERRARQQKSANQ